MQLSELIGQGETTLAKIASETGLDKAVVSRMANSLRMPTFRVMAGVYASTGGEVDLLDWIVLHADALKEEGVIPPDWQPPKGYKEGKARDG